LQNSFIELDRYPSVQPVVIVREMRLICGLYRFDGVSAAPELVSALAGGMVAASLKPEVRLWTGGAVGLGVVDFGPPAGSRSLTAEGDGVLAADRRLDAPAELEALLGCHGAEEDRLIAAAIARWGDDAPDHILGDFAFAHWQPATGRLFCARDLFGVRPFHYIWRPGEFFAFASFPSGLHAAGLTSRVFERTALARHLLQRQRPGESLFEGVSRLPAAHVLEVSPAGLSLRRYWSPEAVAAERHAFTPEAAAAEMRRRLDEAVRCRLSRVAKTGAHLSGGLDSSAISVLAARELRTRGQALHAWSFLDVQRNDLKLEDDAEFVQSVLDQEPGIVWSPVRQARDDVDQGPYHPDLPLPLGAEDPDFAVCAGAAASGVDLILSGWGGDEAATFNGRGVLAEHFLHGKWLELARELSAIKRERGTAFAATIRSEILSYLIPHFMSSWRKRKGGKELRERFMAFLSPEFAADPDNEGRLMLHPDGRKNRIGLIGSPHIAQRCENWAALGARHGLAFAFPMLDRRVVEFAVSLPSELFLREGRRRRLFRDAMRGILPEAIRLRPDKASPFPSIPLVLSEQREKLTARLDAATADATVRSLLDTGHLRDRLQALPEAEKVRRELTGNATPSAEIPALRHTLRLATFVAQRS